MERHQGALQKWQAEKEEAQRRTFPVADKQPVCLLLISNHRCGNFLCHFNQGASPSKSLPHFGWRDTKDEDTDDDDDGIRLVGFE